MALSTLHRISGKSVARSFLLIGSLDDGMTPMWKSCRTMERAQDALAIFVFEPWPRPFTAGTKIDKIILIIYSKIFLINAEFYLMHTLGDAGNEQRRLGDKSP
jgi:hypothetical protein